MALIDGLVLVMSCSDQSIFEQIVEKGGFASPALSDQEDGFILELLEEGVALKHADKHVLFDS